MVMDDDSHRNLPWDNITSHGSTRPPSPSCVDDMASMLGIGFLRVLSFGGILGAPWTARGSFINVGSSLEGTLVTTDR